MKKAGEMNNAITVYIKETYNLHIDAKVADSIRKQVGYEKPDGEELEEENQSGEKSDDEFADDRKTSQYAAGGGPFVRAEAGCYGGAVIEDAA